MFCILLDAGRWTEPERPVIMCLTYFEWTECVQAYGSTTGNIYISNFLRFRPCWEAASCTATQELPYMLWNPMVHYRMHKSTPSVSILNPVNPVNTTMFHQISILIFSSHRRLGLPSGLVPSGLNANVLQPSCFPPNTYLQTDGIPKFTFRIQIWGGGVILSKPRRRFPFVSQHARETTGVEA